MKIQSTLEVIKLEKKLKPLKRKKNLKVQNHHLSNKVTREVEEIDIDLEDPEVGKAAVKIQSSFRGHQARKKVETIKEKKESESAKSSSEQQDDQEEEEIDIDLEDPE